MVADLLLTYHPSAAVSYGDTRCGRRESTEFDKVLGGNPSLLYPTTKGAIIQMTRAMAAHHGKEGIRVNCVCPGMVFTPMVRWRGIDEDLRKARIGQNLMGIEGTGWDIGYGRSSDVIIKPDD